MKSSAWHVDADKIPSVLSRCNSTSQSTGSAGARERDDDEEGDEEDDEEEDGADVVWLVGFLGFNGVLCLMTNTFSSSLSS